MTLLSTTRRSRSAAVAAALGAIILAGCGDAAPGRAGSATETFDHALHDRLPPGVRAAGTIRVGTDASYAPASLFASDGRTIVGFEPDLARALGHVLGVRFEFVNLEFTSLLPRVSNHNIDIAMSAITDTPEREGTTDFVTYFTAGTSIVVQRGNPRGVSALGDLCGEVVAVEEGTVQVGLLQRTQQSCRGDRIVVRTYPTNSDALLQLRTGRAVAVLNDYPPAAHLATDRRTRAHYQLAADTQYEPGLYGIAVAKDRPELREALRVALNRLMHSGAYRKVLRRWGVAEGAVSTATVNAALPARVP